MENRSEMATREPAPKRTWQRPELTKMPGESAQLANTGNTDNNGFS